MKRSKKDLNGVGVVCRSVNERFTSPNEIESTFADDALKCIFPRYGMLNCAGDLFRQIKLECDAFVGKLKKR